MMGEGVAAGVRPAATAPRLSKDPHPVYFWWTRVLRPRGRPAVSLLNLSLLNL